MVSLTIRLGLPNQEGPPAGGFFCCAEFAARGRVSGFEIRPGSDSRGKVRRGPWRQRDRDAGQRADDKSTRQNCLMLSNLPENYFSRMFAAIWRCPFASLQNRMATVPSAAR